MSNAVHEAWMMMKSLLGMVLLAVLAGCEAVPRQVLPYVMDDGAGGADLHLYDLEGGQSSVLRQSQGEIEYDPCIDSTGSKVVFVVKASGEDEAPIFSLMMRDLDVGTDRKLDASPNAIFCPVWSNDGTRIAYVVERDGKLQIDVIKLDSDAKPRTIAFGFDPSWRVDDRAIFYSSRDTFDASVGNLRVYQLKTGVSQSLALRGNGFTNLAGGTSIAYTTLPYGRRNAAVWLIDANSKQRRLSSPSKAYIDTDPIHISGTKFVAFTRTDVMTNASSIYVVERYAKDPVETQLFEADANTYTQGSPHLPR